MRQNRPSRVVVHVLVMVTGLGLFGLSGCRDEKPPRVVDFSDTVRAVRPETSYPSQDTLRVAVAAMVSPKQSFANYREFLDYLGHTLGKRVDLIQRKTYVEVSELMGKGLIDVAFICSGPYAAARERYGFELLAAPQINGSHFYRSYLVVNRASPCHSLEDLRGKTFAFTDPDSNTGRLVPCYWLKLMGESPESFFERYLFTYSHDNSIMAVAKGLVDGAAVDSLIWDYVSRTNPELASKTRVIKKSEEYGMPPVVASQSVSPALKATIRRALLSAHEDPSGRQILESLHIERFVEAREEWYDPIRDMLRSMGTHVGKPDAVHESER
ncbi:MAG: phosphate/phosphite/phosphonate ABC transporter substrate-binding protein [Thermodesulfobacteriota bacterium]